MCAGARAFACGARVYQLGNIGRSVYSTASPWVLLSSDYLPWLQILNVLPTLGTYGQSDLRFVLSFFICVIRVMVYSK